MTRRPVASATWALVAALLTVPVAVAESSEGGFVVEGPLALGGAGSLLFEPAALFVNGTTSLEAFEARADRVEVHRFEVTYVELQASGERVLVHRDTQAARFPLTDVGATAGGGEGWLGLHVAGADLRLDFTTRAEVQSADALHVGNAAIASEPEPNQPWYAVDVAGPHLRVESPGTVALDGGGLLKIMGPVVTLGSDENVTTFDTGVERRATFPPTVVFRWLALEAERWSLDFTTRGPIVAVGRQAEGNVDGVLSWRAGEGRIEAAASEYVSDGGPARLDGRFTMVLAPAGRASTEVGIAGDLRATNLAATARAAAPILPTGAPWIAGGLVTLAVVGAAVLALRLRTVPPSAPRSSTVALAIEEGRWNDVLAEVRRLRAETPRDVRLALDEALALGELGEVEDALSIYASVAQRTTDGAAEYLAAALTVYAGSDHAGVERLLAQALSKHPSLAQDLAQDSAFAALRDRPTFRRLAGLGDAR